MTDILSRIGELPDAWPLSGSLRMRVLERVDFHARQQPLKHTAETGTGKSTLLLSHLSDHHTVFTQDDAGNGDSLLNVQSSPLLRTTTVSFVVGPTQKTLPHYEFSDPLDFVLIDGPHGFPFCQLEYYVFYQRLHPGSLLVLDDIHIRAVNDLFRVLRADAMFELLEVVRTTAFFRRTDAPTLDPEGDGWWLQRYNLAVLPPLRGLSLTETVKALIPLGAKEWLRSLNQKYVPVRSRGS